ncbi:MFS transporter, DHA1 family, bicyclomycin/chloramphenicol resistance protein [Loktanella fryxellensis]|uniref:Bcr/CflA family efflux transporter n=1 Tax=Loktanella fryxellensis TaxID=245187 RepID=A0A1H8FI89_9RHOB|nr:multidrug effflux MFS transporter [Loktanella fryxellensis]SEN31330.1 MFS transporter, DHA1 family, bicyclomycin/chloramphenicol resistance protein [Loktanella fryxellensis]
MTTAPQIRFFDRTTPPHVATLVLLAGIPALNMSIFLPSLTRMADFFQTDYATMQFAVSGYLAATAVLQIIVGPLSDRFGRRRLMLVSLVVFIAATIGALFSTSIAAFLGFRILQAVVATGIVLSRAIVRDIYPPDESASKIGYVTMGMAVIPMIGPTIGGILDQAFGWQSSFVFLSLAGALVFVFVLFDQGETGQPGGITFADQLKGYPDLLRAPRFWGYALCAAFASGSFFAFLGGAAFVADTIYGLSPMLTGAALGAPAIGYALGNFLTGRYAVRYGIDRMTVVGCIIGIAGLAVSLALSVAGYNSAWLFFGFSTCLGLGNGLTLPNATAGLLSVRPHLAGTASGLGGALMIGGGAALSQFAGTLLDVESGTVALQALMLVSMVLGLASIMVVLWRSRQLARRRKA